MGSWSIIKTAKREKAGARQVSDSLFRQTTETRRIQYNYVAEKIIYSNAVYCTFLLNV